MNEKHKGRIFLDDLVKNYFSWQQLISLFLGQFNLIGYPNPSFYQTINKFVVQKDNNDQNCYIKLLLCLDKDVKRIEFDIRKYKKWA